MMARRYSLSIIYYLLMTIAINEGKYGSSGKRGTGLNWKRSHWEAPVGDGSCWLLFSWKWL